MTTSGYTMTVGGIVVEVVPGQIKHLHLGVYPPEGRVRVAAPTRLSQDAVRLAVVSRLAWIRRQQRSFQEQDRQPLRDMVTGETHYFQGRRYRLNVIRGGARSSVGLVGRSTLELRAAAGSDRQDREVTLQRWYRRRLRAELPPLLAKWEPRVGVVVGEIRIRKMKTRWGSCNAAAGRIWLNLELAKKPVSCLEYILVHEMVHLIERRHTERFRTLMDAALPSWRRRRDELNRAPLAHEKWQY